MNIAQFQKVRDAVNKSGNPDTRRGLYGWLAEAQIVRGAVLTAQEELDAEKMKLSIFNSEERKRRSEELDGNLNAIVKLGRKKLTAALDAVIEAKRQQFRKVALSAPTESQIRLLQALALRDDLTEAEVAEIATGMADCLQALKSLGSIARKAGLDFPNIITAEEFDEQINSARQFSIDMLENSLTKPHEELGYLESAFWEYEKAGPIRNYFDPLDTPRYAAVQQGQDSGNTTNDGDEKAKKVHLDTKIRPRPVRHQTDGVDSLSWLACRYHTKIKAIVEQNPDLGLDLDHNTQSLPRGLVLTITPGPEYVDKATT